MEKLDLSYVMEKQEQYTTLEMLIIGAALRKLIIEDNWTSGMSKKQVETLDKQAETVMPVLDQVEKLLEGAGKSHGVNVLYEVTSKLSRDTIRSLTEQGVLEVK